MPFRIGRLPVVVVGCGKEGGACIAQCITDNGLDTYYFRVGFRAVECLVVCSPGRSLAGGFVPGKIFRAAFSSALQLR